MRYWIFGTIAALAALTYLVLAIPGFFDPKTGGYALLAVVVWLGAMIGLSHSPAPRD